MKNLNKNELKLKFFKDKRVLITGHTGFKGSWLTLLLNEIGSKVIGFSKPLDKTNKHFNLINIKKDIISIEGDIRDEKKLNLVFAKYKPEIVFHLAAQSIVKISYDDPLNTFSTNVIGSLNILNAVNKCKSVKSLVYITSDKCYENKEWVWGYREGDELGGHDPYSASKASAEILFSSYNRSFFNSKKNFQAASARAGNVIGGGDWAKNRLIPDCIRAIQKNEYLKIRNPNSTRPWQHVLEPISGYLKLSYNLYMNKSDFRGSWNFGPPSQNVMNVKEVTEKIHKVLERGKLKIIKNKTNFHEANLLQLNCDKANQFLSWEPKWDLDKTLKNTALWYKRYFEKDDPQEITLDQIKEYFEI